MDRKTFSGQVVGPEQAMTVHEALRAYTLVAAYAGHDEGTRGSLKAGKLADVVVWTRDPYGMTAEELQTARVDLTFVGGKVVHPVPRPPRRRLDRAT